MAFCAKCGVQFQDGAQFCPSCGTAVSAAASAPQPQGQQQPAPQQPYQQPAPQQPYQQPAPQQPYQQPVGGVPPFMNTPDFTAQMDPQDVAQNKVMAILAYFGILVLVPIFAAPNSRYARFHANQGILVCILYVAYAIVSGILGIFKTTTTEYLWGIPYEAKSTPWFVSLLIALLGLAVLAFVVLGIINAATGKAKELPLIGKIKILK